MTRHRLLAAVGVSVALAATAAAIAVGDAARIAPVLRAFGPLEVFDDEGKPVKASP